MRNATAAAVVIPATLILVWCISAYVLRWVRQQALTNTVEIKVEWSPLKVRFEVRVGVGSKSKG